MNFAISGVPLAAQNAVKTSIASVLLADRPPVLQTVPLVDIWQAVAQVAGVRDFVIVSPSSDISVAPGHLPKHIDGKPKTEAGNINSDGRASYGGVAAMTIAPKRPFSALSAV